MFKMENVTGEKPLTNRQKQALRTREHIFETAKKLFSANSFEKVTLDQILQACGIGKGTFYHYYASKDALLDSIERLPYQEINDEIEAMSDAPVSLRLERYLELWFRRMAQDEVGFTGHWLKHAVDPDRSLAAAQQDTKMDFDMEMIRRIYREAIGRGELALDTPVDTLVLEIHFSMVGSAVYRCERKGDFDVMQWAKRFSELAVEKYIAPYLVPVA